MRARLGRARILTGRLVAAFVRMRARLGRARILTGRLVARLGRARILTNAGTALLQRCCRTLAKLYHYATSAGAAPAPACRPAIQPGGERRKGNPALLQTSQGRPPPAMPPWP